MRHGCYEWWRLISSAVGTIAGVTMFILFFFLWGNHSAGVWALIAGVFAAVCFHVTYLHFCDLLETWHSVETLQGITLLGVLVSLAGAAGFAWYIFIAVYYHIPVLPISASAAIASVWAALTCKFGLTLFCTSRSYIREIYRESPPLLNM